MPKTGVLVVNLGTPDSPSTADVRKYLFQFLNDPRVIDIHPIARMLLVNLIIVPFRAPKSAKIYKELWEHYKPNGSPLLYYGKYIEKELQNQLGSDYKVLLGMRYQNPPIEPAIDVLLKSGIEKLIVLPLFPQYASASTGSVMEEVMRILSKYQTLPEVSIISNYFDNELFIKAFSTLTQKHLNESNYDHILFSYHGLPERQIRKGDKTKTCLTNGGSCCDTLHEHNRFCYRAQCFATTRLIAKELNLSENQYSSCFQSRLGRDPWIKPYTDDVIKQLAKEGKKRILALVPSFVSDCLETTIEVGEEYKEIFLESGGEHWQMVESLNDNHMWIDCLKNLVLEKNGSMLN
ncbi:MAG: ferrochelatase [Cytophagales bacterium]|nr:MAG: ferrochelatase [Cytophagales bacterium]